MTKQITKAFILQQIQDRFKLREFTPAEFLFEETVVPVYDIAPHLDDWKLLYTSVSITAGPAGYGFFEVPQTERWHLRGYNVVFMGAGAHTVTGVYVARVANLSLTYYLDMTEGQTVSYAKELNQPLVLNSGDKIFVYVDSYTSTQTLRLYIDYRVEELR